MSEYQFCLEKGSKKHICPGCDKKTYVRFIDTTSGDYLPEQYGRCDREINCGYYLNPYNDGHRHSGRTKGDTAHKSKPNNSTTRKKHKPAKSPASYIPFELLKASRINYENNNFISYLLKLFGIEITEQLISHYYIGTSTHWNGATIFWQVDTEGKIRSGKIMLYNSSDGRRIKKPKNHITWVHAALKIPDFQLEQCLFGEHLVKLEPHKPVAIVESEKTAIIASVYYPNLIWLATGSLSNLKPEKLEALKERTVILFPDLNAYAKWKKKADAISAKFPEIVIKVSDLLEQSATETDKETGLDLADYLTRFDWQEFLASTNHSTATFVSSTSNKKEEDYGTDITDTTDSKIKGVKHVPPVLEHPLPDWYDFNYLEKIVSLFYRIALNASQSKVFEVRELQARAGGEKSSQSFIEHIKLYINCLSSRLVEFNSSYQKIRIYPIQET